MSQILGFKLSMGVAEVGGEPKPWACSGYKCKPEETCASYWVGVPASLVPVGVPVMPGVGADVVASTGILSVSDLLGVELPL